MQEDMNKKKQTPMVHIIKEYQIPQRLTCPIPQDTEGESLLKVRQPQHLWQSLSTDFSKKKKISSTCLDYLEPGTMTLCHHAVLAHSRKAIKTTLN